MREELIKSTSKYVRMSPKKIALVMGLIRGKSYEEAIRVLQFTTTKSAKLTLKTLKSAGANASANKGLKPKDLVVSVAEVHPGPILKRIRIVGRSRTSPIMKRTSHIVVGIKEAK